MSNWQARAQPDEGERTGSRHARGRTVDLSIFDGTTGFRTSSTHAATGESILSHQCHDWLSRLQAKIGPRDRRSYRSPADIVTMTRVCGPRQEGRLLLSAIAADEDLPDADERSLILRSPDSADATVSRYHAFHLPSW